MIDKEKTKNNEVEILIVEDSLTQAVKLQYILEQNDYHVTTARNGMEALAYLEKNIPTIILSDIVMPEMDGYQLCHKIRENKNMRNIPIILLTTLSSPQDVINGLECGATNFVTKPYEAEYLYSRINHILENVKLQDYEPEQHGVEIFYESQKYTIMAGRKQILDLLMSTYETAAQKNNKLIAAQEEMKVLNEQLEKKFSELESSEEKFRTLVQTVPDIVYQIDADGKFTFLNNAIKQLGYTPEELIGKHFSVVIHPADIDNVSSSKVLPIYIGKNTGDGSAPKLFDERRTAARSTTGLEVRLISKDGAKKKPGLMETLGKDIINVKVNSAGAYENASDKSDKVFTGTIGVIETTSKREDSIGQVGVIKDITRQKKLEEQASELHTISLTDELTGLYNRRGFITLAEQQLKISKRNNLKLLLFYMDMDNLKWINDNLGHNEGDAALIATVNIIKKTFRESDIIARMGGDEFALLARDASEKDAETCKDHLANNMSAYNSQSNHPYKLSISIGVKSYDPEHPCSIDELILQADKLMYKDKQNKKKT